MDLETLELVSVFEHLAYSQQLCMDVLLDSWELFIETYV